MSKNKSDQALSHDDVDKMTSKGTGVKPCPKGKRQIQKTECSSSESEDSLETADHLINDIDEINAIFVKRLSNEENTTVVSNGEHLRYKPLPGISDGESFFAVTSKACISSTGRTEMVSVGHSKLAVIDTMGKLDLDALDRWASSSKIDIDWPNIKEDNSRISLSVHNARDKTEIEKFRESDTAVEEIDAIIQSISHEKQHIPPNCVKHSMKSESCADCGNGTTCDINDIQSPARLSANPSMPNETFYRPLQSVRLPPVKNVSITNDDIFHRKLTDVSLPHIPRPLPKLQMPHYQSFADIQQCTNSTNIPGPPRKDENIPRAAKYATEYLLPGQVSQDTFVEDRNQIVNVRNIVLDYSSDKKRRSRRSRVLKLFACIPCCHFEMDDDDIFSDVNKDEKADSVAEIHIEIEEERRSIPSRLWRWLKRRFGF